MLKFQVAKGYGFWRVLGQWIFLAWILFIGARFGLFVYHFTTGGTAPFYSRPPGVEGFLPIGALVSLKHWLTSGVIHPVHPAALVLFLTFLAMSLLARKSFCSWFCPVGTLSEAAWKIGQRWFGRNFRIWHWLDLLLRSSKYLLLLFFVKLVLFDMPTRSLAGFLGSPYWAASDIKMLHFFTDMSLKTLAVLLALFALSLPYKNFWCRYLCPYGALLGLLGSLSPFKIRRCEGLCTGCGTCSRACPSLLPVARKKTVRSPECTGCLSCVDSCPESALTMSLPGGLLKRTHWAFPLSVFAVYAGGILLGMSSGHWETTLTYRDYQQLIMFLPRLGF